MMCGSGSLEIPGTVTIDLYGLSQTQVFRGSEGSKGLFDKDTTSRDSGRVHGQGSLAFTQ